MVTPAFSGRSRRSRHTGTSRRLGQSCLAGRGSGLHPCGQDIRARSIQLDTAPARDGAAR